MGIFSEITTVSGKGSYDGRHENAWTPGMCASCGQVQFGVVALYADGERPPIRWLKCTQCGAGAVKNGRTISPAAQPLRDPRGVPEAELAVWREVRSCLGVGADTAAVMLARKLLLHLAVDKADLDAKNDKDRAPTFEACLVALEGKGFITPTMRSWADKIKEVGNEANHELTPITGEQALAVATFVEQLLVLVYEMDALMVNASAGADLGTEDAEAGETPAQ